MLQDWFAQGVQAAMAKFAVAGQPSLSSVGMAPPVTKGLPPAAKPISAHDLGITGNPNSAKLPLTPSQVLPALGSGAPRLSPPKLAEAALCTSCRQEKHYGPCARVNSTPGGGVAHGPEASAFIRTKLRGE
jgi:hypothetical protein